MPKLKKKRTREKRGVSLVEMLIVTVIFSSVAGLLFELVALNAMANSKLNYKVDALNSARFATELMLSDVRCARGFGDLYASSANRHMFPDTSSNPFFTGSPQSNSWRYKWPPPAPFPSTFFLSGQCLIVQRSVAFLDQSNDKLNLATYQPGASQNPLNGLPTMLDSSAPGVNSNFNMDNLETSIYFLIADPKRPNEYLLQRLRLPGADVPLSQCTTFGNYEILDKPQTIIKGIVGPIDPATNLPRIFRYYCNQQNYAHNEPFMLSESQITSGNAHLYAPLICGVAVDVEMRRPDAATTDPSIVSSGSEAPYSQRIALHVEAFKRSNHPLRLSR